MPREIIPVKVEPIVNRSGLELPSSHPSIQSARAHHTRVVNKAVAGDAPKDFLKIYEYGQAHRANPSRWPAYIAKIGKKWYPNESITEHLLTRIGQAVGIEIADSRLMLVRGQLRFLSRFFLRPDESLIHGAEIFADYLNDQRFVDQVEEENREGEVFTFEVVEDAVLARFGDQSMEIMSNYVRLLVFDALVGNNDRHFYNWGVITDVKGRRPPRFSPVYDTARGLFWNVPDSKLEEVEKEGRIEPFVAKYVKRSSPKTGWDTQNLNHFEFIKTIAQERSSYFDSIASLDFDNLEIAFAALLDGEFEGLFSPVRQRLMKECLRLRKAQLLDVITSPR